MITGEIEIWAEELRILSTAETPPMYIEENLQVNEALRLKYRYLDLRRPLICKKKYYVKARGGQKLQGIILMPMVFLK